MFSHLNRYFHYQIFLVLFWCGDGTAKETIASIVTYIISSEHRNFYDQSAKRGGSGRRAQKKPGKTPAPPKYTPVQLFYVVLSTRSVIVILFFFSKLLTVNCVTIVVWLVNLKNQIFEFFWKSNNWILKIIFTFL